LKRGSERGAVAIMTAVSMVFLIAAVALTVDIGDVVVRKRHLQKIADLASLDAVQALGPRRSSLQSRCVQALGLAQDSAKARNSFDYTLPGNGVSIVLGTLDRTTKVFTPITDCSVVTDPSTATAVKVTAITNVPFAFMPGSDNLSAVGISAMDARARFTIGTKLARFDSSKVPLLDALLGCAARGGGSC
jgi:uncharacterized membrane protein